MSMVGVAGGAVVIGGDGDSVVPLAGQLSVAPVDHFIVRALWGAADGGRGDDDGLPAEWQHAKQRHADGVGAFALDIRQGGRLHGRRADERRGDMGEQRGLMHFAPRFVRCAGE